jgi:hypothetical protein
MISIDGVDPDNERDGKGTKRGRPDTGMNRKSFWGRLGPSRGCGANGDGK